MRMRIKIAMKQESRAALTPKLRFPEFRDAPEWKVGQLSDALSSLLSGLSLEQGNDASGYKVTRIETISDGSVDLGKVGFVKTSQDVSAYKLDVGDILLSNINSLLHIGKSVFIDRDFDLYHGMNLLRLVVDSSRYEPRFISHLIHTDKVRASIRERANKAVNQASINQTELGKTKLLFPLIGEQQKIAECLTSLDEVIAAQSQKIDALKIHKKGLMQQLFPRESETLPRLRFPEFQDAPGWEEKNLGSVGDVLMCKRIFASETNDRGGVPFYKIGTLGREPDAYISEELFENYKSRYNFPRVGEVLITCSGTVGKCLPYDGRDAYYQDSNIVWIDNPTREVSNELLLRILSNVNWGKLNSTTITRIYGPDLKGLSTKFPTDPYEQQRIADCLTSLDDLLAAQSAKLEALKTHKKGLMQQLFPSPQEVQA